MESPSGSLKSDSTTTANSSSGSGGNGAATEHEPEQRVVSILSSPVNDLAMPPSPRHASPRHGQGHESPGAAGHKEPVRGLTKEVEAEVSGLLARGKREDALEIAITVLVLVLVLPSPNTQL